MYTSDIPKIEKTNIKTYADDTAILTSNSDLVQASTNLQNHFDLLNN